MCGVCVCVGKCFIQHNVYEMIGEINKSIILCVAVTAVCTAVYCLAVAGIYLLNISIANVSIIRGYMFIVLYLM